MGFRGVPDVNPLAGAQASELTADAGGRRLACADRAALTPTPIPTPSFTLFLFLFLLLLLLPGARIKARARGGARAEPVTVAGARREGGSEVNAGDVGGGRAPDDRRDRVCSPGQVR